MDESSIIFPSLMGQLKRNRYVSSDLNLVIVGYAGYGIYVVENNKHIEHIFVNEIIKVAKIWFKKETRHM